MGIYEFDQELYDKVLRDDGEVIGIEKGKERGDGDRDPHLPGNTGR